MSPLRRGLRSRFSMLFLWGWFWFSSAGRCLLHHRPSAFWVWRLVAHRRRQSLCRRSLIRVGKQCILLPLPSKIGTKEKLCQIRRNYGIFTNIPEKRQWEARVWLACWDYMYWFFSRVKRVVGFRKDWYGWICGLKLILVTVTGAMRGGRIKVSGPNSAMTSTSYIHFISRFMRIFPQYLQWLCGGIC